MNRQTPHPDEGKKSSRRLGNRVEGNQTKRSTPHGTSWISDVLPKRYIKPIVFESLNIEKDHIRIAVPSDRSREHIAKSLPSILFAPVLL